MAKSSRFDGRRVNQLRPLTIETDVLKFPLGSVLIKSGDTHLLCSASVEERVPPFMQGRGTGWVTAEYEMLPSSTPTRKHRNPNKVDGRTQEIRRLIGRSLRAAVDKSLLGERTIWLDCDVLQADGGTRTLAITGAWLALAIAVKRLRAQFNIKRNPMLNQLAAVSVGVVDGKCLLDLCYQEDSKADVDMNVVMTNSGEFIELQGTAEAAPFNMEQLNKMLGLAKTGCKQLLSAQRAVLKSATAGSRA